MPESVSKGLTETVTLSQARSLIECLAHEQSVLLLSPPGIGKSDSVVQAAEAAGLPCKSLLGTQIAPEDVSGIPRIVGERSVFCPPRILLPEDPQPFCLFLDELPACSPDIQKAFYSLLLERRLGEHPLPKGTWVVAAGNRAEDRALVRSLSSALVNRVIILNVRVDNSEWLQWAKLSGVRPEIRAFMLFQPASLMRPVPDAPVPFSTPRAWASLSRAMDLVEQRGLLTRANRRALAFGRLSADDAAIFCAMAEASIDQILPLEEYLRSPKKLPSTPTACWFVLNRIRTLLDRGELQPYAGETINTFLATIPEEHRMVLLVDRIKKWDELGASSALLDTLKGIAGL
ncbi:MAG: AAA family ATPase [Planctomycetaceae bacterium]